LNAELVVKLYEYTEGRFVKLDVKIDKVETELKSEINRIYNLVDQDLKRRETDVQEREVMNHQLDRYEDWIALYDPRDTETGAESAGTRGALMVQKPGRIRSTEDD
jgi:hypothetical protein